MRKFLILTVILAACGKTAENSPVTDAATADADGANAVDVAAEVSGTADAQAEVDAGAQVGNPQACADLQESYLAWNPGPYGVHRHEVADDFTLPLMDGSSWNFKEHFLGCENYVFLTDIVPVSDLDATSLWENSKDLDALLKKSPMNTHYFFVSLSSAAKADTALQAMADRVATVVAKLPQENQQHWTDHLHVVQTRGQELDGWIHDVVLGHGQLGFGIDRTQHIRGFGLMADVTRSDSALQAANKWPWKANLAYALNEPQYWNAERKRDLQLAADGEVLELWKGETLAGFAEVTMTVGDLSTYDTLQVEVDQQCPDADKPEPGNCGAWDYLAWLALKDANGKMTEIARFITSYHRETHWIVDATAMLPLLKAGATTFHWEFAPTWNTQPTRTWLKLRLSKRNKGMRPTQATYLWNGGGWNKNYDAGHPKMDVPIAATTKHVELWALITGHGGDAPTMCSEFCNHQHDFTVGGKTFRKEHKEAGSSNKCMPNLEKGMVPNQGGTWWFGRGGWCPGMQVDPWVQDVTDLVKPGQTASIEYHGKYQSATPPDTGGNIDGGVWLIQYE